MTFRKLLIILTFVVTALIIMLLGTSYAWYQFDNAFTSFNNVQTFTEGLGTTVVFANNNSIATYIATPILESEVPTKAEKTLFSITPQPSLAGKDVAIQIDLTELEIDSVLTNTTDLKYSLVETVGSVSKVIVTGNFNGVTNPTLNLKPMTKISVGSTYSYEFRLWLQETGANQNSLMGAYIGGIIKVSTLVR